MKNYERIKKMSLEEMSVFINEKMNKGGVCNSCSYDEDECLSDVSCELAIRRFLELESEDEE